MLLRYFLLFTCALSLLGGEELQAQGSILYTNGKIRVKGEDWKGTRITVMPQFGDAFEVPLTSDHFDLDMGLLSTYLVRAAHEGCATKEIVFDLWVPDAYRNATFSFPFEVTLETFKANEEAFSYDQPIGAVFFDEVKEDFTYTTDYSSIKKARSLPTLVERMNTHIGLHPKPVDQLALYEAFFANDPNAEEPRKEPAPTVRNTSITPIDVRMPPTVATPPPPAAPVVATIDPIPAPKPTPPPPAPVPVPVTAHAPVVERATPAPVKRVEHKATSSHISTRLELPAPEQPLSSHEVNVLPTMVMVIDRFANGSTSTEVRKVTHAYGAVFYFQDGEPITERAYQDRLAEFAHGLP